MLSTIINPHRVREQLRGRLVAAEKVGDNLAKMHTVGAGTHVTRTGKFAKWREVVNFLLRIDVLLWRSLEGVVGHLAWKVLLMNMRDPSHHGGQRRRIVVG
jgi:hypothetical protein